MSELGIKGKEKVNEQENPLVPIGGKLSYYVELRTGQILDILLDIFSKRFPGQPVQVRKQLSSWLYSRTRPGLYIELFPELHLAYGDQRDGHGTQHYWRLFFNDKIRKRIEYIVKSSALTVGSQAKEDSSNYNSAFGNKVEEWGGMFFRSKAEIAIAKELDKSGVLFFGNIRGRINGRGSPVSNSQINGRLELDFLVFKSGKAMILEVDGMHHREGTQTMRDYTRDRLLLREGIPTARFTGQECLKNPGQVVEEFLNLFKQT